MDKVFDDYNEKRLPTDQALAEIARLIDETEAAVRAHEDMASGRKVYDASTMLQRLLYAHYKIGKEKAGSHEEAGY